MERLGYSEFTSVVKDVLVFFFVSISFSWSIPRLVCSTVLYKRFFACRCYWSANTYNCTLAQYCKVLMYSDAPTRTRKDFLFSLVNVCYILDHGTHP